MNMIESRCSSQIEQAVVESDNMPRRSEKLALLLFIFFSFKY